MSGGNWTWTPGATPDPNLVSSWGYGALTDPRQDPAGDPAKGAWQLGPSGGRDGPGWQWVWGGTPDPTEVGKYGPGPMTDPKQTPTNQPGLTPPPPPSAAPPTLNNTWDGVPRSGPGPAPDMTGTTSDINNGGGPQPTQPPSHRAYVASPGDIRNTENVLLRNIDAQMNNYNSLKGYVTQVSTDSRMYSDTQTQELIINSQNQLLLQIADMIRSAGDFTSMLNNAGQNYVKADQDSAMA